MTKNGFLHVLQALNYFNVFQDLQILHLDSFEELFDGVTGCDETVCGDTYC